MVRGKDFRQPRFGDVRINLRGGEIAVAEQHLHHAQVGAVIDEMGRKGMAQGVRRDGGANADGNRIIMNELPESAAVHRSAARRDEQHIAKPPVVQQRARLASITRDHLRRLLAHRHEAHLVALAAYAQHRFLQENRRQRQPDQLAHP